MKNEQEYTSKILELFQLSPNSVRQVHIWLAENLIAIESTCQDTPICTKLQLKQALEDEDC